MKSKSTSGVPAIISPNTHVQGQISCEGELQIDGKVTGDLQVESLIVGQQGIVEGNIVAKSVQIKGTVDGGIEAEEVHLEATSKVHGDVTHDTLIIDAGALIEGKLTHKDAPNNITHINEQATS